MVGLVELALLLGSASTAIAAISLQNQAASAMSEDGKVGQGAASSLADVGNDKFVSQGSSVVVSACQVPAWKRAAWPVFPPPPLCLLKQAVSRKSMPMYRCFLARRSPFFRGLVCDLPRCW